MTMVIARTPMLAILTATLLVISASGVSGQEADAGTSSAVSVQGTSTLVGQLSPGEATMVDGVISVRDNVLVTIERASDPRVSGRAVITVNFDAYPGTDGQPGATQVRYGSMRLENEGGTWSGRFAGRLTDTGFSQTYWLEGDGEYAGLSYVVTAGGSGSVWSSQGLIYPGRIPPIGSNHSFSVEGPARDRPAA